ncbi:adenylate isopentenyltransferase-like [Amaranthus tricolor]|uniref:adenylate isopentenyltransferase-like n=1 Tax=Amaranthus tricolor TaxID=29722 RepID=UPI00258BC266|nr:adenylate isopentenyltransferase-like [Amaranthus tricolor]
MRFTLPYKYFCIITSPFSILASIKPPSTTPCQIIFITGNRMYCRQRCPQDKVVAICGATGAGKSRLSIDIATRIPSEIVNSDKIQVNKGLNITTNKISIEERRGVPHHLLGEIDSALYGELTPFQYRLLASKVISNIISRGKLPLIVGGSNSLIYALLSNRFNPDSDIFSGKDSVCSELKYRCCFIWIDVSLPVLNQYLVKRVDDMLDSGMLDELAEFYKSEINTMKVNCGLTRAIGVPEFERYFRYGCKEGNDSVREGLYDEAVRNIKDNTCQLAKTQIEKIQRLQNGGWCLNRIDGTDSFRAVLEGSKSWSDIWQKQVIEPSMKIVNSFLNE